MIDFRVYLSQLKDSGAGDLHCRSKSEVLGLYLLPGLKFPLIMRTKPGVDNLSFDDLYNNLRVFEPDVKGSTASSSSMQNVAFVSENTSSTNEVSTAYGASSSSGHNPQKEEESCSLMPRNQLALIRPKSSATIVTKTGTFAKECRSKESRIVTQNMTKKNYALMAYSIQAQTISSIHYALTVSPVVSTTFFEQFWMSAKSKTINNVRYMTAKVIGKPVTISEASIRSNLLFDDADGIDTLNNQAIFDTIQLMGYEGDLTVLTFNKAMFSPQWKFLFHTMNHCISSISTSWDQIPTNIATAVICLATNQKYNFSKLIFDGIMRHLDAKKKFVMYPRVISVFLANQLKNVSMPLDCFPINALTSKVLSFMVKKGKNFLGNVTPLFDSMLVQLTEDEGEASERPSESQPIPSPPHPSEDQPESQTGLSPRPYPFIPILDSIPEGSGRNHGGQSSSDRSLSGNEDGLTL
ncbi:hypothetical protein Tco_0436542 [Tanacetum coccineum]